MNWPTVDCCHISVMYRLVSTGEVIPQPAALTRTTDTFRLAGWLCTGQKNTPQQEKHPTGRTYTRTISSRTKHIAHSLARPVPSFPPNSHHRREKNKMVKKVESECCGCTYKIVIHLVDHGVSLKFSTPTLLPPPPNRPCPQVTLNFVISTSIHELQATWPQHEHSCTT